MEPAFVWGQIHSSVLYRKTFFEKILDVNRLQVSEPRAARVSLSQGWVRMYCKLMMNAVWNVSKMVEKFSEVLDFMAMCRNAITKVSVGQYHARFVSKKKCSYCSP